MPAFGAVPAEDSTTIATTGVPPHGQGPAVPCDCDKSCGEGWPFILGVALLVLWIQRFWSRRRQARPAPPSSPDPPDGGKGAGRNEAD